MKNLGSTLLVHPPVIDPAEFLPQSECHKLAATNLTSPPGQWGDEVTQALLRDHPYVQPDRLIVRFNAKDDAAGYATGHIGVDGAPRLSIPVIIAQRSLKPLDVLIIRGEPGPDGDTPNVDGDQVLPLTEDTFNQALDVGDIGETVPRAQPMATNWTENGSTLQMPFRGRTAIASTLGVSEEQKLAFGRVLETEREVAAGFAIHNPAVANAWLEAPAPAQTIQAKIAEQQIRLAEAKIASDFPLEAETVDMLAAPVFIDDGSVKVATVFECINLANPVDTKRMLLFEDGSYCPAPEKVAVAAIDQEAGELAHHVLTKIASKGLHTGDTVSFYLDGTFTEPAKIASIQTNEDQSYIQLAMSDALGRAYPITLTNTVKQAMIGGNGGWVIPMTNTIVKVGEYAAENMRPMPLDKVASYIEHTVPDSLVCSGGQFTLNVAGRDLGVCQVSEEKCASVLRQWFSNADVLMAYVKEAGHLRFDSNLRGVVEEVEKQSAYFREYPEAVAEFIEDVRMPLEKAAKLAAALGSPEGADMVLGTGFLSEDNLAEFVGLSDELDQTIHKLAKLLLFIRMGLPEGDESATLVAMKALQRVATKLRALGSNVVSA